MKKTLLISVVLVGLVIAVWFGLQGGRKSSTGSSDELVAQDAKREQLHVYEPSYHPVDTEPITYSEEQLSDPVKALLGLADEKQNYNSLEDAISKLSKGLGADDVVALRDMLTWPNDRFPEGMRPIEINAVKNDVLDRLLRQNTLPEGIGLQMVEMAGNTENDPVWRDYCVQFMQPFYERLAAENTLRQSSGQVEYGAGSSETSDLSASSAGQLQAVREAMYYALDERDSTIAGTSLIGLEMLSRTHDEFDRDTIVGKAAEIAADESASTASRMTAMRLSVQISNNEQGISNDEVADTARLLAQTGETVLLRAGAIVTLGEVGTDDDRELLESYSMDGNQQIADAAKMALQKMDAPKEPVVDLSQPAVAEESAPAQSTEKLPPVLIN